MENHALLMVIERFLDAGDELVTEEAVTSEIRAILEVDNLDLGGFIGFNGELVELNNGVMLLADVIICDERGGGTENSAGHHGSKTECGIFWILILMVGRFMGFVDNDKTKFFHGGEDRRTWANNDAWMVAFEGVLPEMVSNGLSLFGMEQDDVLKVLFEVVNELGSEGDFRDE